MDNNKLLNVQIFSGANKWNETRLGIGSAADDKVTENCENGLLKSVKMNGILASCFVDELRRSERYRKLVWGHLASQKPESGLLVLKVVLIPVKREVIDHNWCEGVQHQVYERIELDHMMSWLSTLGGAFSSLGEQFTYCAEMAGKISVQQYRLAVRLGDPFTRARCRLFLAISLMQRGRLKAARHIVEDIYRFGKSCPQGLYDHRLIAMCRGIWARLRYTWRIKYSGQG